MNAKGDAEDNEVEQLITSIEQKQQEIQTQIDHRFETALQEAAGKFETYKKQDTPDAKSLQEFLTTFRGLAQEPEVSSELISVQAGPKALAMQCETLLFDLLDYASQVMHHYGGDARYEWNTQMRELLLDLQSKEGHESGSWAPQGGHDRSGGRVYATSLALLTLEVYYRHKRELQ